MIYVKVGNSTEVKSFDGEFTIGTHAECGLMITGDPYVSVRHARMYPLNRHWWAEDMGSTNGTYLHYGTTRVNHMLLLRKGDKIRIGHTVLTVVPE